MNPPLDYVIRIQRMHIWVLLICAQQNALVLVEYKFEYIGSSAFSHARILVDLALLHVKRHSI